MASKRSISAPSGSEGAGSVGSDPRVEGAGSVGSDPRVEAAGSVSGDPRVEGAGSVSGDPRVEAASPTDFFTEVVDGALETVELELSSACRAYIVSILSEQAVGPTAPDASEPFALRLGAALTTSGGARFEHLRRLGDDVLFMGGFFEEHLARRGIARAYLVALGTSAYHGAQTTLRHLGSQLDVFTELSLRFESLLRLLASVADRLLLQAARSDTGVLELYERWSRTRSKTLALELASRGLFPSALPLGARSH